MDAHVKLLRPAEKLLREQHALLRRQVPSELLQSRLQSDGTFRHTDFCFSHNYFHLLRDQYRARGRTLSVHVNKSNKFSEFRWNPLFQKGLLNCETVSQFKLLLEKEAFSRVFRHFFDLMVLSDSDFRLKTYRKFFLCGMRCLDAGHEI